MSFTQNSLETDPLLNKLVKKVTLRETHEFIRLYDIKTEIYWTEDLRGDDIGKIRPATDVENLLNGHDVIICLSKEKMSEWDEKNIESIIAHLLLNIDPCFRGSKHEPTVKIKKNYYQINPEIVSYYGKNIEMFGDVFRIIDNLDPKRLKYKDKTRRKGCFAKAKE